MGSQGIEPCTFLFVGEVVSPATLTALLFCIHGRIRTDTELRLKQLTLPIGLRGHYLEPHPGIGPGSKPSQGLILSIELMGLIWWRA